MARGHILVVEDDEEQRKLYADFLSCFGYDVSAAAGWEDAVVLINGAEDVRIKPILVILDVMIPDMDGFEICRRLRQALGSKIPILFFTAYDGDPATVLKALQAGGNDFLVKSGSLNPLLDRISHWTKPSVLDVIETAREKAIREITAKLKKRRTGYAVA